MKDLTIKRTVGIGFDADRWELFELPGRDEAAAELNAALEAAINADLATAASVRLAMRPVREKHRNLGADDGEAEGLIEQVVDMALVS